MDLGQGHDIELVLVPNLHWPDTMFSYDPATCYGCSLPIVFSVFVMVADLR